MLESELEVFLQKNEIKRLKLNQGSEQMGNTYKVIAKSVTLGENIPIFTCSFSSQGWLNKLSKKQEVRIWSQSEHT